MDIIIIIGIVVGILLCYLLVTFIFGFVCGAVADDPDQVLLSAYLIGMILFLFMSVLYLQEKGVWDAVEQIAIVEEVESE